MLDPKFMANDPEEIGIDPVKLGVLLNRVRKHTIGKCQKKTRVWLNCE